MKTGIGGKMSDKKSVLEEVMKDMEDGKEIKIPSTSIKDFVERKYGMSDKR
jgi:predicted transcriptional regulator